MIGQSNSSKATALYSTVTIPIIKITRIELTYTQILMQYGSLLVFSFIMASHTQNQKPKIDLLSLRNNNKVQHFKFEQAPKKLVINAITIINYRYH